MPSRTGTVLRARTACKHLSTLELAAGIQADKGAGWADREENGSLPGSMLAALTAGSHSRLSLSCPCPPHKAPLTVPGLAQPSSEAILVSAQP